ncbi:MAG: hypothetical protein JWM56_1409 [Candidatus Peribacteria bacterium]|nr:hypothetical protein [Candidatus Peribacteria bacterium]
MPLKHFSETVLIVILGFFILLTGLFTATLPLLPEGLLPALILLGITLLYPLAIYPYLRNNRADYSFRLLHFIPAITVSIWLFLQIIALWLPIFNTITALYTWGWTLVPVLIGMFLLMVFCLNVLRRWVSRLAFLTLLLVPFMVLAVLSGLTFQWERSVASLLWQGTWWNVSGTGSLRLPGSEIAMQPKPANTNLSSSTDAAEQAWRNKLRELQNASSVSSLSNSGIPPFPSVTVNSGSQIAFVSSSSSSMGIPPFPVSVVTGSAGVGGRVSSVSSSAGVSSASQPVPVAPVPKPAPKPGRPMTHLPKSGLATDLLPFFFLAGFCTIVQRRADKRKLAVVYV